MRKFNPLLIALAITTLSFGACKKSETEQDRKPDNSETLPQFNNTTFGVYKGTLTSWLMIDQDPDNPTRMAGSGNIKVVINNGKHEAKAYINIDNITKDTLTSTVVFTPNQPVVNALFTGRVSSIRFSVAANGTNAVLNNVTVNNRWHSSTIEHSLSIQPVEVYEGTFVSANPLTSDETGLLNFIKMGDSMRFIQRFIYGVNNSGAGQATGAQFTLQGGYGNFTATGVFNGNLYTGAWQFPNTPGLPRNGTFSGKRTL